VDSVAAGDAMRIVTVVELAIVAGLAMTVFGLYYVSNKHISKADSTDRGALTRYVVAMALSYVALCTFAIAEIEGFYGTPLTWRTPIGFVAANLGMYALVEMLRFQNMRLDRRDRLVRLDGTPEDGP
jgi:drug/metabolite transporter (DMT)-like permease